MKSIIGKFLESLNREFFMELCEYHLETTFKRWQEYVQTIEPEFKTIKNWISMQLEHASSFSPKDFENSLFLLKYTIFEDLSLTNRTINLLILRILSEIVRRNFKIILTY